MRLLGSDSDGVTDISLKALAALKEDGKKLEAVGVFGNATDDISCMFYFSNDECYKASGFSIGYGGEGPHGLYKAIKMWYPSIGDFHDTPISSMSTKKNWLWTPSGGFREAETK
jgi:hypothetical protein